GAEAPPAGAGPPGALHHPPAADRRLRRASLRRAQAAEPWPHPLVGGASLRRGAGGGARAHARRRHRHRPGAAPRGGAAPPPRAGREVSDGTDGEEETSHAGDDAPERSPRRHAFSLAAIAGLTVWKVYEALAADTMQAAIAPSLYTMGLAGFAV